ncbi:MAG: hypothetical protein LBI11_01220 [Streptococcaceae bacterium]|jgi:hypothetical protein|nr:hypothetical protein [Streptococcaceae bacterium]
MKKLFWLLGGIVVLLAIWAIMANIPSSKNTLQIKVDINGVPSAHTIYSATNVSAAFQQIKSGNISSQITQSNEWSLVRTALNETSTNTLSLNNGLTIGTGKKLTDDETQSAIKALSQISSTSGKVGLKLILAMNSTPTSSGQISYPGVVFHNPESPLFGFTNSQGEGETAFTPGWILITDADTNFITLKNITKTTARLSINLANTDDLMTFDFQGQNSRNNLVVGYGREFSYYLKVSKAFTAYKSNYLIGTTKNTNIVIDNAYIVNGKQQTKLALTKTQLSENPLNVKSYGTNNSLPTDASILIGNGTKGIVSLSQTQEVMKFSLDSQSKDTLIKITAHLAPIADPALAQGAQNNLMIVGKNPGSFPGLSFFAFGATKNSQVTSSYASPIYTSGINFVMTDKSNTKLATGMEYALGKHENGNDYYFQTDGTWKVINENSQKTIQKSYILKGGKSYLINENNGVTSTPISFDPSTRVDSTLSGYKVISNSLIKILGLAPSDTYFLYPVKPLTTDASGIKKQPFSVFNTPYTTVNNTQIRKTSIGFAKNQGTKINALIPDWIAGQNEYNILAIDGSLPTSNYSIMPIFVIVLAILAVLIIGIILFKKF